MKKLRKLLEIIHEGRHYSDGLDGILNIRWLVRFIITIPEQIRVLRLIDKSH